jgi:hypothetical protein
MDLIRKHFWTAVLLIGATIPLLGLMIYADRAQTRSADELVVADRCVDLSHESDDAQLADGPDLEAKCGLYFRARSNENADEDLRRWELRAAQRAPPQASTSLDLPTPHFQWPFRTHRAAVSAPVSGVAMTAAADTCPFHEEHVIWPPSFRLRSSTTRTAAPLATCSR